MELIYNAIISLTRAQSPILYNIWDQSLPIVTEVKDLGVYLGVKLTFSIIKKEFVKNLQECEIHLVYRQRVLKYQGGHGT